MAARTLARGRLRRPPLELALVRCPRAAWELFGRHHYLSGELNPAAECYLGLVGVSGPGKDSGVPAAFCAFLAAIGRRGVRRASRVVVLPDYQGIGIGGRLLDLACGLIQARGQRATITTSHPSMIAHVWRSARWRIARVSRYGRRASALTGRCRYRTSAGRGVVSAEFV
jgi:GNAT superfamily N-acetyltransferase